MDKTALLDAFQRYLDENDTPEKPEAEQTADLYSLLTEMAALRTEVKTESRQFKTALDDFKSVFENLQTNYSALSDNVARSATEQQRQLREAQRGLLLDMLDLYDRMSAGLGALQSYQPNFWSKRQDKAFIHSLAEGQGMTLRRVAQILERYHVQPIDALGKVLDPHQMRAVDTVSDNAYENGCVVEELRKGFMWENDVLRLAEVKVNKLTG